MKKKFLAFAMALVMLFSVGIAVYATPCDYGVVEPMTTRAGPGEDPGGGFGGGPVITRPPPP